MKGGEKMKRQAIFTVVATLILYGVASAAIINTAHDLSTGSSYYGAGLSGSSEQICVFCHTPHFPAGISAGNTLHLYGTTNSHPRPILIPTHPPQ